jgi:hypothetical protein
LTLSLPNRVIAAGELLQHISRIEYAASPLHFGNRATNRYDDPAKGYGVLYLSFDLSTALMESVFHQHQWHRTRSRTITLSEIRGRIVRAVGVIEQLNLADLTAPGVMAQEFGLNLGQLASRRYVHTQRISRQIHEATDNKGLQAFDGLLYPSRNNYPAPCIALFHRARVKVVVIDDLPLAQHVDWPAFVAQYRIGVAKV